MGVGFSMGVGGPVAPTGPNRVNGKLFWNNEAEGDTLDVTFLVDTYKPIIGDSPDDYVLNNGGINNGMAENGALAEITIERDGIYRVDGSYSLSGDTTNTIVHLAVFKESVEVLSGQTERLLATVFDVGSANTGDSILCNAGDVLRLEAKCNKAMTLSFEHITWLVS